MLKIGDTTIICDEVFGNGSQAKMGLNFVEQMPRNRGLIFYLDEAVEAMDTSTMKFALDILYISKRIIVEVNAGVLADAGYKDGDEVTITRVLSDA